MNSAQNCAASPKSARHPKVAGTFFIKRLYTYCNTYLPKEDDMDKKQVGIIATVVTALCCGCPGLFSMCFGAVGALASFVPGAKIDMFGSKDPKAALLYGVLSLCGGIIFLAIPIVVGVVTLRKKPEVAETPVSNEPVPPAS
jgi:hypothetical protein